MRKITKEQAFYDKYKPVSKGFSESDTKTIETIEKTLKGRDAVWVILVDKSGIPTGKLQVWGKEEK